MTTAPGTRIHSCLRLGFAAGLALAPSLSLAQGTNTLALGASLPDAGLSLLRVIGSLGLVLALFFGAVWCFKNWQRLAAQKGRVPKLRVLEVRSLGHRQALYLVACEQQRLLVASSPAGVTLLAHLPEGDATDSSTGAALPSFAEALQRVLAPKT
jgi:flagellar biosynthetic protein FliO